MGTWGTGIKDNDAFADVYSEFFDRYNKGDEPDKISKKLIEENWEILEIEEERNSLWFALGLALWETQSLNTEILAKIEAIISTGEELNLWHTLGASEPDIKKRKAALEKFFQQLKSDRPKAKSRKKPKQKSPIFATGDCLTFKMNNGNYGGAIVLATDDNPETAYNLVATTRINQVNKPAIKDFEQSEILVCNFANWQDSVQVTWHLPDLYFKDYAAVYEVVGNILVEVKYDIKNRLGEGYLFKPSFTAGWKMNYMIEQQLESEKIKPKPDKSVTLKQLTKPNAGSFGKFIFD
jgi:hypothetical protein